MAQRDPLDGRLVVLTGGSGFFGRHVAEALLERGARLRIASRNPEKAFRLRPLANLGQLQFARMDVRNANSVDAAMAGADAVVNLVGSFKGDLVKLIAGGARNVAQAARKAGATAMVHISAIGADKDSPAEYARAKAQSEEEVFNAIPTATVLRPSVLFGEDDRFVTMFAGLVRTFPVLPVFAPQARLQLLYVEDAAAAVSAALGDPIRHGGKTYEIAGPEPVTMLEFNRRIAAAQRRERHFIEMPDALSGLFASLPGSPMGKDQWHLLRQGNTPSGDYPGLSKLGIQPRPLGLFLDRWMTSYRRHGRFGARTEMPG